MITNEEMLAFLQEFNVKNGFLVDVDTLNNLVLELMIYSQYRPLPNLESVQKSSEIENFFISIFKKLHQQQKKSSDAITHLKNLPDNITQEYLKLIQVLVNTQSFKMESNRLFRENNQEALKTLIGTTLTTISSQDEKKLLSNEHLSALTKISLELHSAQYTKEIEDETSSIHIIHFYENEEVENSYRGKPRAAEYLQPYDSDKEEDDKLSFDKTNHALGSGIYGVGKLSSDQIDEQVSKQSFYQIVEIKKPLRLYNQLKNNEEIGEAELWTELSKLLQRLGDKVKAKQQESRATKKISREEALQLVVDENKSLLAEKAQELSQFRAISLSQEEIFRHMLSSLNEFLQDSKTKNSNSLVAMPINYLISKLKFTGVVSDANDIFSRGLILTHVEDSYLNLMKVAVKNVLDPLLTPFQTTIKFGASGPLTQEKDMLSEDKEELKEKNSITVITDLLKKASNKHHLSPDLIDPNKKFKGTNDVEEENSEEKDSKELIKPENIVHQDFFNNFDDDDLGDDSTNSLGFRNN